MPVEVVAIFGPTASGKSALAEAVADALATEVVSADALQVYRGLPILTNQPRRPTRLVGIRGLGEEMSVGEYAVLAHGAVDELVARTGFAVVAGGTGLYFRAALADLRVPSPPRPERRRRWEETYDADPVGAHRLLAATDAAAAAAIHVNDRRRVVRALELAEVGESLTVGAKRLWHPATRRPTRIFGLDVAAGELSRRIVERTESMLARGVVSEVRAAARSTVSRTAAQALGLRDLLELPEAEAAERIVARTRRYAAYQRKWMRRIPGIEILDGSRPLEDLRHEVLARATA